MTNLVDLDIFARVVTAGSMSGAGRGLGLSPAVISKRIRRLEERLGTRLLHRTTRQIALTEAGQGFHERVVAILASVEEAEAWVTRRSSAVRGVLRVSAPTSFGRLHIAPHLTGFLEAHPELTVDLVLSDAFVDIVGEGFDLAVRIADLQDSSLVARRLAANHRVLCASPSYLDAHGVPAALSDLAHHRLLAHNADQWRLEGPDGPVTVRVESPLKTNSSEVVRESVIAGAGIALRSTWDVGPELRAGKLRRVLPGYGGSRKVAIHAVYASRRQLAQKVRAFIDHLADLYGPTPPWDEGLEFLTRPEPPRHDEEPQGRNPPQA
jgi:DNA-binding transcriptional LysR family regulator